MEKAKLGISVGLLSALAYLSGYLGVTVMLLVVGYIFIREENRTLKKNAVNAVVLFLVFVALNIVVGLLSNGFSLLNFGGWMYDTVAYTIISGLISSLSTIVDIAEKIAFGLLAIMALLGKDVKIPVVDKFVEKNL